MRRRRQRKIRINDTRPECTGRVAVARLLAFILPACTAACGGMANVPVPQAGEPAFVHLLNRAGYGPSAAALARLREIGIDAYLDEQLDPAALAQPADLAAALAGLATLHTPLAQLSRDAQPFAGPPANATAAERRQMNQNKRRIVAELAQAKILRAVLSPAQLQEVMADFWFNHFNVFAEKGADKVWIGDYEREAIRPYALGKFRDLLAATARHPAMLFYLDNWLNSAPNAPVRGKRRGINENYARELLELHTLGVDAGYTQQDVGALAHILTGWGLSGGKELWQRSAFHYAAQRHDPADVVLLHRHFHGDGIAEVNGVLDMLAAHPATARHLAFRLAQNFVDDRPPERLVAALAARYLHSGGDIAEVLRALFHSAEFWDARYRQNKFKPPFRYVVSALRVADIVPADGTRFAQYSLRLMGEPLYRCLTPDGYANSKAQWLNPDAIVKRMDFAASLQPMFRAPGSENDITRGYGNVWTANTLAAVRQAAPQFRPLLLLNSPEFLYY